jgi:hypothetical protein
MGPSACAHVNHMILLMYCISALEGRGRMAGITSRAGALPCTHGGLASGGRATCMADKVSANYLDIIWLLGASAHLPTVQPTDQ